MEALERNNFRCRKTEYLIYNFHPETQEMNSSMMIEGGKVLKCEAFCYLRSTTQQN